MKFNLSLGALSSVVFSILMPSAALSLTEIKSYKPQTLEASVTGHYFSSNKNYDSSGESRDLSFSNTYSLLQVPFGARYIFSDVAIRLGSETSYAEAKNNDPLYRGDRTNSTLDEISAGFDYKLFEFSGWELITDLDARFGLIQVQNTTDDVPTHEGITTVTPSIQLQTDYGNFEFLTKVGYGYRSNGRSQLLPWAAQAGIKLVGFSIGGEIAGSHTIGNDKDKGSAQEAARLQMIQRANAGSYRIGSINPTVVEGMGYVRYASESFKIAGYGGTTLSGSNSANGSFVGATLTMLFDFGSDSTYNNYQPRTRARDDGFETTTDDGVDQKHFNSEKPITTPAKQAPPKKVQPKPAPKSAPVAPAKPVRPQIQQQLDEAEMVIELKRRKKK